MNYTTQMDAARKGIVTPQTEDLLQRRRTCLLKSCRSWSQKERWRYAPTGGS